MGVSNNFDPDQARRFVGHDLGSKYLEKLPANDSQTKPLRSNKKISVFRETGLKIIGNVATHFFNYFYFSGKKYNFMHFGRHIAFQSA